MVFFIPNSPVPRLSFATRFDTKLREKSFEKQYSAKAVLFTMYIVRSHGWYLHADLRAHMGAL